MQVPKLEEGIFIGDSVATSHMISDMTGLYNLQKISGSVMIGNAQNIRCTHEGLLDVICIQRDGSTAEDTWEIKVVPQLNHDLFSFTSAMTNGRQMNGRWKKNGTATIFLRRQIRWLMLNCLVFHNKLHLIFLAQNVIQPPYKRAWCHCY